MRPFDLTTWASIAILVVGSIAVFVWFLKDAGEVLRGDRDEGEGTRPGPRGPTPGPPPEPPPPAPPPSCFP